MQLIYSIDSILSITSLLFVAALSIVAVLSHCVNDNLLERIGLAVLCFACVARSYQIYEIGDVETTSLLLHMGLAILFAGSGLAKWRRYLRKADKTASIINTTS